MDPIKFCLNVIAAIILAPLMPIVVLAWLAVWLTPEKQTASVAHSQVQSDVVSKRLTVDSKVVLSDSIFSFVI